MQNKKTHSKEIFYESIKVYRLCGNCCRNGNECPDGLQQRQVRFPLQDNVLNVTAAKGTVRTGKVKKAADLLEMIMRTLFTVCGFIAVGFVVIITVFLIISGVPAIKEIGIVDFLFGTKWASTAAEPSP